MRIAQIAPLYESVPPSYYGGTERVVSYLTEELVRQHHEVTLFASGDSVTSARLVSCCTNALRLDKRSIDPIPHHLLMLEHVCRMAREFDLLHFHIDYLHYPISRRCAFHQLTTLHGRLDIPDLVPLYQEYREMPVISISESQRRPLSWVNWHGTVHHGLPAGLLPFSPEGGDYLAFVGRISPEKGVEAAIEISRRSGIKLKIAAKVDKADRVFYETEIKPLLDGPLVEYVGEICEEEKKEFLGNALSLIFPINWEEPFGLVLIESMACGTPVIAFRRGSVPEVIGEGVSGFIVDDVEGAVRATSRIGSLSRAGCRRYFEEKFLVSRMAADYLGIYQELVEGKSVSH